MRNENTRSVICLDIFLFFNLAKTCNPITPPINGLVTAFGQLFKPFCRQGFYPNKAVAPFYICNGDNWVPAGIGEYPIPDCLSEFVFNRRIFKKVIE